jgi:hypothetical protein
MAARRGKRNGTAGLDGSDPPMDGPGMRKEGFRRSCAIDCTSLTGIGCDENSLSPARLRSVHQGFTTAAITMPIIRTVGTSLITRK